MQPSLFMSLNMWKILQCQPVPQNYENKQREIEKKQENDLCKHWEEEKGLIDGNGT